MNNYLGEETYVLMFPDGKYLAGFPSEIAAWSHVSMQFGSPVCFLKDKGYAVGKCFVFIPENV